MATNTTFVPGESIARQVLNLFYVIDNSGSMSGERIGAVNNAMRDIALLLPEIQDDTADCEIKVSTMTFSDTAKWITKEPQNVQLFKWKDITVDGGTNLESAYLELSYKLKKISKGGYMPDFGGVAPIIFLMTDGEPNEGWQRGLEALEKMPWYHHAIRYAVAIGIDQEHALLVLNAFTNDSQHIIRVYSPEALRQVIRIVAITASKVQSKSSTNREVLQADIIDQEITDKLADLTDVQQGF